jgi:hypothetical protein
LRDTIPLKLKESTRAVNVSARIAWNYQRKGKKQGRMGTSAAFDKFPLAHIKSSFTSFSV